MYNQSYFNGLGGAVGGTNDGVQEIHKDDRHYTRCENPNTGDVTWYAPKNQGGAEVQYDRLPWVVAQRIADEKAAMRREKENERRIADEKEKTRREGLAREKAAADPFVSRLKVGDIVTLRASCTPDCRHEWKFAGVSVCSHGGLRLNLENEKGERGSYGMASVMMASVVTE